MGLGNRNNNSDDKDDQTHGVVEDVGADNAGGDSIGSVSCSICLDVVSDNGDRSWAKLQCGHQFHLDCIGSAFNVKGTMQCPNCRKIEKGQWLYANGCRSSPEYTIEDWTQDEDLYDLNYSEMPYGVHWCPFGTLARFRSSYEDGEFSSAAYHETLGQYTDPTPVSSATHPCPYIAYLGPVHPSSSSSNSSGSVADNSGFSNHWSGSSVSNEMPNPYPFPTMDLHYQTQIPPAQQRNSRARPDFPRPGPYGQPFVVGHSARTGSPVTSSMITPYPGNNAHARAQDRIQALQAYYQQHQPNITPPTRVANMARRTTRGGMTAVGPPVAAASPYDQSNAVYFVPSSNAPNRNFQDPWERNLAVNPNEWPRLHETASRTRQRHGSERSQSQNRS